MKKLILASNNAKKLKELKAILSDMDVEILSQREAGCNFEVEETGTTFAENAYLRAKFVSSICCLLPDGTEIRTEGECRGQILTEPHGEGGFGYDPVFMPDGYSDSMAVLGSEVKNKISHRAHALEKFRTELRRINGTDK